MIKKKQKKVPVVESTPVIESKVDVLVILLDTGVRRSYRVEQVSEAMDESPLGKVKGFQTSTGATASMMWAEVVFENGSVEFCGVPFYVKVLNVKKEALS